MLKHLPCQNQKHERIVLLSMSGCDNVCMHVTHVEECLNNKIKINYSGSVSFTRHIHNKNARKDFLYDNYSVQPKTTGTSLVIKRRRLTVSYQNQWFAIKDNYVVHLFTYMMTSLYCLHILCIKLLKSMFDVKCIFQ